jgi:hypothetical protein
METRRAAVALTDRVLVLEIVCPSHQDHDIAAQARAAGGSCSTASTSAGTHTGGSSGYRGACSDHCTAGGVGDRGHSGSGSGRGGGAHNGREGSGRGNEHTHEPTPYLLLSHDHPAASTLHIPPYPERHPHVDDWRPTRVRRHAYEKHTAGVRQSPCSPEMLGAVASEDEQLPRIPATAAHSTRVI